MRNILLIIIIFLSTNLLGQDPLAAHLSKLASAPVIGEADCRTTDDYSSFGICPYADRDTVYFSHESIPPVHNADEVIAQIDSVVVSTFEHKTDMTAIRRDSAYNLVFRYEYIDAIGGTLAQATYPSCVDGVAQTIVIDLFDLSPGASTPVEIKALYGDTKDLITIVEHELGHHLNLRHSIHRGDLMWPHYEEGKTWSFSEDRMLDMMYSVNFVRINRNDHTMLTKNFRVSEFFSKSYKGDSHWLHPSVPIITQIIRDRYVSPIYINSTYRNVLHNTRIGGSKTSAHLTGRAVDFSFDDRDSHELFTKEIENKGVMYRILIRYGVTGIGIYNSHIHIDFKKVSLRVWDSRGDMEEHGECKH